MSNVCVIASVSLFVLSSCSVIGSVSSKGKGKAPITATASAEPAVVRPKVDGPSVKAGDDDPPNVTNAIKRLDEMEQMIGAKEFAKYARESRYFQTGFLFHKTWEGEKKNAAMKARLAALDAAAFKAFGGRIARLGAEPRVVQLDRDAVEAVQLTVEACRTASQLSTTGDGHASAELAGAVAKYEKAMARALKLDASALRYYGEPADGGATIDAPTHLMECEVALGSVTTQFADEYAPEVLPEAGFELGCGVVEWTAEGVQIGSGQFAPYTRSVATTSSLKQLPCKSIPRRSSLPKALVAAANEFAQHADVAAKDLVEVTKGAPTIEVNRQDLHTYRYQRMRAYSKAYKIPKNPCGADKVFCEAGGSQVVGVYNRLEFSLERAAAHAGNKPELCKDHLKTVVAHAEWFEKFHAEQVQKREWIAGATYKTRQGAKLSEKQLIAAFTDNGQLAEDRMNAQYCRKPAK